jgi:hypothetical protein
MEGNTYEHDNIFCRTAASHPKACHPRTDGVVRAMRCYARGELVAGGSGDTTTGAFTQLTNGGANGGYYQPTMSADGTRIAFNQCCNVIVLYDTTTCPPSFTQLTPTPPSPNSNVIGSLDPAISADGRRIAFASTLNLTPDNPGNPDGNSEIFLADITTSPPTLTQLTNTTTGGNVKPAINVDGTRIAFNSSIPDNNGVLQQWLFLYDTTTPSLTPISSHGENPAINADGTRITFFDTASGGIILYDTKTATSTPIPGGNIYYGDSAINADGTRIAVLSSATLLNGGTIDTISDNLFLLTCGVTNTQPPPPPCGVTDTQPPTITINSPADGSTFILNQSVLANYSCADPSGVSSCTGPVANGSAINTSTVEHKPSKSRLRIRWATLVRRPTATACSTPVAGRAIASLGT